MEHPWLQLHSRGRYLLSICCVPDSVRCWRCSLFSSKARWGFTWSSVKTSFILWSLFLLWGGIDDPTYILTCGGQCIIFSFGSEKYPCLLVGSCFYESYTYLKGFKYVVYNVGWGLSVRNRTKIICLDKKKIVYFSLAVYNCCGSATPQSPPTHRWLLVANYSWLTFPRLPHSPQWLLQLQPSPTTAKVNGQKIRVKRYAFAIFKHCLLIFPPWP